MAPSTEVPELEPVISNRKGRPRASTLEAQRATPQKARDWKVWRKSPFSIFRDDEVPDDLAEGKLRSEISKSEGDARKDLQALLSDYTRFKDKPGFLIGSSILFSWTYQRREIADDGTIGSKYLLRRQCYQTNS